MLSWSDIFSMEHGNFRSFFLQRNLTCYNFILITLIILCQLYSSLKKINLVLVFTLWGYREGNILDNLITYAEMFIRIYDLTQHGKPIYWWTKLALFIFLKKYSFIKLGNNDIYVLYCKKSFLNAFFSFIYKKWQRLTRTLKSQQEKDI